MITNENPIIPLNNSKNNNYSSWIVESNNTFIPEFKMEIIPKLIPGKYKIKWNNDYSRYTFVLETVNLDELLFLPNPVFNEIINDIDYFWNNKTLFEKYKFVYKRGILLYGNPGCGKSSITILLSQQVINKGGIVLCINNASDLHSYLEAFSSIFRCIQPNTPVLVIYEDLDGLVKSSDTEAILLNVLDGINQSKNVVNIGCTNYPENLKKRILNRPSRFDKRYYIGLPDSSVRKYYFEYKIQQNDIIEFGGETFINQLVKDTEGLTLSHLGELIKSVFIFKNSVEYTIDILKQMSNNISSFDEDSFKLISSKI